MQSFRLCRLDPDLGFPEIHVLQDQPNLSSPQPWLHAGLRDPPQTRTCFTMGIAGPPLARPLARWQQLHFAYTVGSIEEAYQRKWSSRPLPFRLPDGPFRRSDHTQRGTMAEVARKLSDAVHMEKAPVIDELVEYMNNLDPPPSEEEVRKVVRKIDMRLPPFLFILYVFTWLDRGALGTKLSPSHHSVVANEFIRQCRAHEHPRRPGFHQRNFRLGCRHV